MTTKKDVRTWDIYWDFTCMWETTIRMSWKRRILCEKVRCKCWKEIFVRRDHLFAWRSKNCWCFNTERIREMWLKNKTHWMDWTKFYNAFHWAKERCRCKSNKAFHNYWWRWIKCEWEKFEDYQQDMYESYLLHIEEFWDKNTSLDRIDVNWNYSKENCRWATWEEQERNRRNNHHIIYDWEIKTLSQWEKLWFWKRIIWDRIKRWWDFEKEIILIHNAPL